MIEWRITDWRIHGTKNMKDQTLTMFRIQSGYDPKKMFPSTKNAAIASNSATSSGVEPVKALKDRFSVEPAGKGEWHIQRLTITK